ncbi:hypothetical protein IscW_ISCW012732 [Ixodes scapularis]|uniref:Uncharacterized protein n=1 Tax=Ixodes scapularis TaxID=6945 RepID=B7QB28_IXOSC|nr:hypothetical protein IscW_ISCW012732 [Ixodes scapularis]|eukprot:XP_002412754.1 hypothetical protein IscW_ISCW012732 [Ixodes scapularis]
MFQITLGMGQLLDRLDQLAQNVGQQTQSMDRIVQKIQEGVLSMQENAAFRREKKKLPSKATTSASVS